ncbi:hypothetical protein [Ferrimonas senticii]|uniref:hypothetical protein n=1 Tax=Ferrimonas senticii TaxID=394566 RepID=UPI0003F7FE76|nr:hypothetical protein [Ferrimonas senticii]
MKLLGKGIALLFAVGLVAGCQSNHSLFSSLGGNDDCCCCKAVTIGTTERDSLWAQMQRNRAQSLAAQPQGRECTARRCEAGACRTRL